MKRFLLFALVLLLAACGRPKTDNNIITIGKIDSLHSHILGEERKIWIYLPEGAKDTSKRFPVIYLLDGDGNFATVVGIARHLTGSLTGPEVIIVGIPNTDRMRDLTPTHSLLDQWGHQDPSLKTSGGGEKFTAFIQKELMPAIDSLYPVAPFRMLIGHSLGGLTVMNIAINHPDMFNSYIAIDPTMVWDKQKLLKQAHDVFRQKNYNGKSLYLGIANTMPDGMDTLQVRSDTNPGSSHIRSLLQLKDILQRDDKIDGLNFSYAYYKNDDHGSVALITEYDGLRFIFSFYKMPARFNPEIYDPKNNADLAADLTAYYDNISKHMGYTVLPPKDEMNGLAHYLIQDKQSKKAYSIFAMNLKNYPKDQSTYDGMGDYYASQKEKVNAIGYYEKAQAIKDDPKTKKKLDS
ncbi:MAG TPA: alpha/beta hydrolase-fold protein, partial [Mucilaginibacter sp.]